MQKTKKKQILIGRIVNLNSGINTASVEVETLYRHPVYEKLLKQHRKFLVHITEENKANYAIGQKVKIESTRPYSGSKSWRIVLSK